MILLLRSCRVVLEVERESGVDRGVQIAESSVNRALVGGLRVGSDGRSET